MQEISIQGARLKHGSLHSWESEIQSRVKKSSNKIEHDLGTCIGSTCAILMLNIWLKIIWGMWSRKLSLPLKIIRLLYTSWGQHG